MFAFPRSFSLQREVGLASTGIPWCLLDACNNYMHRLNSPQRRNHHRGISLTRDDVVSPLSLANANRRENWSRTTFWRARVIPYANTETRDPASPHNGLMSYYSPLCLTFLRRLLTLSPFYAFHHTPQCSPHRRSSISTLLSPTTVHGLTLFSQWTAADQLHRRSTVYFRRASSFVSLSRS